MLGGCNLYDVAVVGAGWAGCAAAIEAAKKGGKVALIERTDMLLGTGIVGGIMRNNGRYTASEELIAMGGGDLIRLCDENSVHKLLDFPGHKHSSIYDTNKVTTGILKQLSEYNVDVLYRFRVTRVKKKNDILEEVYSDRGDSVIAGVFVDATGTAGPIKNCIKYGNGCAMCIYRCPSFGGRLSLTELCNIEELECKTNNGLGAMSGSCKIHKDTLDKSIIDQLAHKGLAVIEIPFKNEHSYDISKKTCQQYNLKEFKENIILLDTGTYAKMMVSYYPLESLRQIPGFKNAVYSDPYSGGIGNSIRYTRVAPCNKALKVEGVNNLFCAGEKAGLMIGHTEAICTGVLAGFNALKFLDSNNLIEYPKQTVIGDFISHVMDEMKKDKGRAKKYTFSGSDYFNRMKELGMYDISKDTIVHRVEKADFDNIF